MLVDNLKVIKIQEEKDTGSCEISVQKTFGISLDQLLFWLINQLLHLMDRLHEL